MRIWQKNLSVEDLNNQTRNCIEEHLGIKIVEIGDNSIQATMPVDHRTKQPFGLLHGGSSVVLAETLGSVASYLCLKSESDYAVGIEVNANHIRSVDGGFVRGKVSPIHLGKQIHIWEIRINDSHDKLVCVSRLTVAILTGKS